MTSLTAPLRRGLAMLLLASGWSQTVGAQTIGPMIVEPDDVPGRRVIPEYTPIGYDFAGFDVLPAVTFGIRADDNVFTRTSVKRSDLVAQVEPRLRLRREDKAQNFALDASARSSTYLRLHDQNSAEYRLEGTYTRGTTGTNSITANLGYRRETIQRGTVENDLASGSPLMRRVLHGSLTGRMQFNRLSIDGQILTVLQRYEQIHGRSIEYIDQRFRNANRLGAQGVISYEVSARSAIFAAVEYDRFDYALSPQLGDRDANNWSSTAGIRYEISRLLYAQIGLGYRSYDFRNPGLQTIRGPAISGHLRYFPSRLLAVRGTVEQFNTTSPYDLVGAVTLTTARVEAEYEMKRSLSLLASMKGTLEDYGGAKYSARRVDLAGGARLRFNRWLAADANLGFSRRFVNRPAPFEPYSQVYAMLSVTFAQ